jgi:ferredoxin-NADP reductase
MMESRRFMVVRSAWPVAEEVLALELVAMDGSLLPAFEAGAHVDLHLPAAGGLVRSYSICSDPADRTRYVVAVALAPDSRGGSRHVHAHIRAGQVLEVGGPRNHFPLAEDAPASVLVAGGIGVTPLVAMARRLAALARPWTLYLCARTPERAAFLPALMALPHGRVVPVFDAMPGVAPLDIAQVVQRAPAQAHLYCCGPASLMRAFQVAARGIAPERIHMEWFSAPAASAAAEPSAGGATPGFQVRLQRSGRVLSVGPDETLLEVLERSGIYVACSCRDGVCGTCEVPVLAGTPEHRDCVLSAAERARGDRMLACVSRSSSPELVLDL